MLAVEACVVAYARKAGEDEEKWAVTALLHDFDWEIHPNLPDHPTKGEAILAERGVSEEIRRAILSHADFTGVPRVSPLEKTLFACDELAGFLTACSYVKPGRSIHEVETSMFLAWSGWLEGGFADWLELGCPIAILDRADRIG